MQFFFFIPFIFGYSAIARGVGRAAGIGINFYRSGAAVWQQYLVEEIKPQLTAEAFANLSRVALPEPRPSNIVQLSHLTDDGNDPDTAA